MPPVRLAGVVAQQGVSLDAAGNFTFAKNVFAPNLGMLGMATATIKGDLGRPPLIINDDFLWPAAYYQNIGSAPSYYSAGYYSVTGIGAGVATITTGTTTTGANNIAATYNFNPAHYSKIRSRVAFFFSQLSTGTDTYVAAVGGFSTTGGSVQQSPMAVLQYTDSVNGGRFQVYSLAAAGYNTDDSGVTVVANKLYIFDFTLTPTAPGAGGNALSWAIYDSAGTVLGSASRTINVVAAAAGNGGSSPLAAGIIKSAGTTACLVGLDSWQTVCLP